MELWIRSQDKRQLLKVNDGLYIANGFSDTDDTFIGIKDVGHVGRYITEERALEVLDEIQNYLINNAFVEKQNGLGEVIDLIQNPVFVYQMPEE